MSDTPRTDELEPRAAGFVPVAFARELERHNSHLSAQLLISEHERAKLIDRVARFRSVGVVYKHPDDWSYAKNGGGPTIEDCESVDLSEL